MLRTTTTSLRTTSPRYNACAPESRRYGRGLLDVCFGLRKPPRDVCRRNAIERIGTHATHLWHSLPLLYALLVPGSGLSPVLKASRGREAPILFGWIFAIHQVGASVAAFNISRI